MARPRTWQECTHLSWDQLRSGDQLQVQLKVNGVYGTSYVRVHRANDPIVLKDDDFGTWDNGHMFIHAAQVFRGFGPMKDFPPGDNAWETLTGIVWPGGRDYDLSLLVTPPKPSGAWNGKCTKCGRGTYVGFTTVEHEGGSCP